MNQPLFAAPDGYVVDLENPQRTGQAANLYVGSIGLILATLLVGVRLYTKVFLARKLSTDDGALLVAWSFSVAIHTILLLQYSRATLGVHIWEIPAYRISSTFDLIKIGTILYSPFLAAAKFSLLFFYLRLSRLRWFRIAIFASMLLVVGSNIGLVFPYIFACTPVSKIHGSCLDPTPIHIASGALNVTTNILLLGLPIPVVLKWKTSGLERAGVLCIFGVGIATCAASIIRLALTYPMLQATDQTWAIVTPSLYTLIEANLIIITITLPTARLFLHHIAPTLISAPHLQPSNQPPGPTPHITRPNRLDIELTTTCSSSKPARKRYSRMTNDSASIISAGELSSWKAEVGSRKSVVTIPSPALDRSLSRKSVGTIVKTRTTTVTSELVPDLGEYERRASWAPPF